MPSTLTSPQTEALPDIDDSGRGAGALPPVAPPPDKRTGGNGDDGGDDFQAEPVGKRGPGERRATARIGLASSLLGVFILFAALASGLIASKGNYHTDPYGRIINSWLPIALPTVLWLNTAVLFLSSATAEMARRAMFHEKHIMDEWFGMGRPTSKRATLWIGTTLALGMLFLVGQWVAWLQLQSQRAGYASSESAHYFYLITGAHAVHLFIGVSLLMATLSILRSSRQFTTRQLWVDTTVWYWHAMGVLWVALFALLEFFQ